MPDVTMAGNLPGDAKYSNVEEVRDDLVEDPQKLRMALVVLDVYKTSTKTDDGETTPTLRIRRIEIAVGPHDTLELEKLMARLSEARVGALPLSEASDEASDEAGDRDAGE